jgi:hypothetical protein
MVTGLSILAILIYFLVFRDSKNKQESAPEAVYNSNTYAPDLIGIYENNSTVVAYIDFVENTKKEMSLNHAYTNEALLMLSAAVEAMASEVGYEVQADMEKVKEYAEMITVNPFETTHADNIRKADDVLTQVLENIQKAKYPGLANEVLELKIASKAIKPGILTLDQKDAVKNYFAKASDLLQKMN